MCFNMNKLALIVVGTCALSGCASKGGYWECSGSVGGDGPKGQCKVGGKFEAQVFNFIRPVNTLLAETLGYSISDLEEIDFNEISIDLDGSGGTIENNKVTLTVYDGDVSLGYRDFSVTLVGGEYKLSDPNEVKNWAYNFIDIGDSVEIDFKLDSETEGTTTLAIKHQGAVKASASVYMPKRPGDDKDKDPV